MPSGTLNFELCTLYFGTTLNRVKLSQTQIIPNQSWLHMIPRILTIAALVLALGLLFASRRLTEHPVTTISLDVTVPDTSGGTRPGEGLRFDLLEISVRTLIDSLASLESIEPSSQIMTVLEDPAREAFLRGLLEQKGFPLSRAGTGALLAVLKARSAYLDYLAGNSAYSDWREIVGRVNGPTLDLAQQRFMRSVAPALLHREARLYTLDPRIILEERGETPQDLDSTVVALGREWSASVEVYAKRYSRELLERVIATMTAYRDQAVASVETDTTGHLTFPPVPRAAYWVVGFYPQNPSAFFRACQARLLRLHQPEWAPALLIWDSPVRLDHASELITLTPENTQPLP